MRHGNPKARSSADVTRFPSITYYCLDENERRISESGSFPTVKCPNGIQTTVYFPECWDGKNLDSPDHSSHVAIPSGLRVLHGGICPSTHPVVIPQILMETRWTTEEFSGMWTAGDRQPFVWSNGDREGWSFYGSYLFGWKGDSLKDAFAAPDCKSYFNCGNLTLGSTAEANKCKKDPVVQEKTDEWLSELPGGVKVWD